jgi:hypothetical protein
MNMKTLLVAAALLCFGCGGEQRQVCYAQAEATAHVEAERLCNARGLTWDTCPDAEQILGQLQADQEACQ